jgi:hypothetical protein
MAGLLPAVLLLGVCFNLVPVIFYVAYHSDNE